MVMLGKVTAPKPVNLPSQRCVLDFPSHSCPALPPQAHVSVCLRLQLCSDMLTLVTILVCRHENQGLDPNVNLVHKYAPSRLPICAGPVL